MRSSINDDDLTYSQLEILLGRLHGDRDRAALEYEDLRRKMIRFFRWNGCQSGEDLADEVFDRVAQRLGGVPIDNVVAFLWGVARNLVREASKKPQPISIDLLPATREPHSGDTEARFIHEQETQRRLQCLRRCLQRLPAAEREQLLEYEHCLIERGEPRLLAAQFGLTIGALRTRVHRLRHRLELCSRRCLAGAPERRSAATASGDLP
jgi:DNA-directed RNA polymerase specialized sigma24 family protein